MKRPNIRCPYCGSRAYLRPASVLDKTEKEDRDAMFYVCARYPACDSYVTAHAASRMPMGTLANRQLRQKRRIAHLALNELWQSNIMTRKEAYRWLQLQLGLEPEDTHIAMFLDYRCGETIRLCRNFMNQYRRGKEGNQDLIKRGESANEAAFTVNSRAANPC